MENAIARADALEARRALVSTACNLVCDEKGAEVLLEAGLIQALLPWLPPLIDVDHTDALIPLKCRVCVQEPEKARSACARFTGAVPPLLAVLKASLARPSSPVSSPGLKTNSPGIHLGVLPESLLPAARALWHIGHTRHGLGTIGRSGGLSVLIQTLQRPLKQPVRLSLLELSSAVLHTVLSKCGRRGCDAEP